MAFSDIVFQPLNDPNLSIYGWEIASVKDAQWQRLIRSIHLTQTPIKERIRGARKVLRSDYRLAWYFVFALYRYTQTLTRWGVTNWLDALAGPIRLKALKVLDSPPGYEGRSYDSAMMALELCCKAKDTTLILKHMRQAITRTTKGDLWTSGMGALERVVCWKPELDYPEIVNFIGELLASDDDFEAQEAAIFLENCPGSPAAIPYLQSAIHRASPGPFFLHALATLLALQPQAFAKQATEQLAYWAPRMLSVSPGDRKPQHARIEYALRRMLGHHPTAE